MQNKKSVVVSGATGGIGTAIVRDLAQAGWQVFAGYRQNLAKAQALAAAFPDQVIPIQVDVRQEASVDRLFQVIDEALAHEPLEALVNAAGIDHYGLLQDLDMAHWEDILATNVTGSFLMARAALPQLIHAKHGSILNISSIWGARGAACEVAYSTSKGAIDAFTKALAQELAPSQIRVNALAPGVVATAMFDHLSPDDQAATLAEIPFARPATADEIAKYARFLLSEEAAYMTGQVITVAGGFVI
ncbi:elongation factor P 5-aminopentanone reductase [Peptococcus simiae]|uniref:elongation factor P 5-aminopentanone reductase n=1 Tax=Peptococcus simiae TaxID=1643805 RepID=UPI003980D96E